MDGEHPSAVFLKYVLHILNGNLLDILSINPFL